MRHTSLIVLGAVLRRNSCAKALGQETGQCVRSTVGVQCGAWSSGGWRCLRSSTESLRTWVLEVLRCQGRVLDNADGRRRLLLYCLD